MRRVTGVASTITITIIIVGIIIGIQLLLFLFLLFLSILKLNFLQLELLLEGAIFLHSSACGVLFIIVVHYESNRFPFLAAVIIAIVLVIVIIIIIIARTRKVYRRLVSLLVGLIRIRLRGWRLVAILLSLRFVLVLIRGWRILQRGNASNAINRRGRGSGSSVGIPLFYKQRGRQI